VHGFTESLSHEVKPFGIHATLVMPGYFRTNFLEGGSLITPQHELAEYQNVRDMQEAHQNQINNNQPGDPEKAAEVMIKATTMVEPPVHLFLGADAYKVAEQKIELVEQDMETYRAWATATDIEEVTA
jgi:NAD(P)-dependent dehydrogenase (short-subunit alcohol dehydrogenase family)